MLSSQLSSVRACVSALKKMLGYEKKPSQVSAENSRVSASVNSAAGN